MNEPITWGSYLATSAIAELAGFVFLVAFIALAAWSRSRFCQQCGRRLQWRWRKPWQYAARRFCPFHDDGSPYP